MQDKKPVFGRKKIADGLIRGEPEGGGGKAGIRFSREGGVRGGEGTGAFDGQLGLSGLGGEIRPGLALGEVKKLGGKGEGGFPGFFPGFLIRAGGSEFHKFHGGPGGDDKSLLVVFVEGFEVLGRGLRRGHLGGLPAENLDLDRSKEAIEPRFCFARENRRGGAEGSQQLPGANLVKNGLIEALAGETLRREEVGGEALEKLWVVGAILEEKRIVADGGEELIWLGLDPGIFRCLVLEKADPGLDGDEAVVIRGNPPGLQSNFKEGLALGGDQFVEGEGVAPDAAHFTGGRIHRPRRGPVAEKNKGDGDHRQKDQKEALHLVMQICDHGKLFGLSGGEEERPKSSLMVRFSLLVFIVILGSGWAQDRVRLKSGEVVSGTAVRFDDATQSLTFNFDKGTLSYAQTDIAEVQLLERPGVGEGRKALEEGKMEEVVAKWQEPVNQYLGVDNPWVLECAGGLGQAYLALGRVADAESLYGRMKKAYSSGPAALRAEVGLAVATSGKDAAGLLAKLQALEKDLKESLRPLRADREAMAEFYFARGEAFERKGEEKKALEDYLRVSILYPDPPSLGLRSARKAEALRQSNKDLVTD